MADIFFSPLNQFRFVPNSLQIGDRFNTNDFDEVLFPNQKLDWQGNKCFSQPVQPTDGLKIIYSAEGFVDTIPPTFTSQAHLIKKGSGIVKSINISLSSYRINNRFHYFVNSRTFFDDVEEGIYAIVLELYHRNEINPSTFDRVYYYSDSLNVKNKHENSLWVQYSNYYSKLGIPFEQLPSITKDMGVRIYGSRTDIGYTTERTIFDDQNNNPMQLKATASRLFTFYFGGNRNQLPDYLIDKLNHIFTCSTIIIDNVEYVPTSDSAFEKEGDIVSTLYGAKITLAKKDNLDSYNFEPTKERIFRLVDLTNNTYPYAIESAILIDGSNSVINPSVSQTPTIIQTLAQRNTYVLMLNNSLPTSISGRFSVSNNVLVFTKEEDDNVVSVISPIVHQRALKIYTEYTSLLDSANIFIGNMIFRSDLMPIANNNATYNFDNNTNFDLVAPSSGIYYCLVFVNNNIEPIFIGGREFVNIESLGNNSFGYGSDSVSELQANTFSPNFAQILTKWAEGFKVNGVVTRPIGLSFQFENSYFFPSMTTLGNLGFNVLSVENSGFTTANADALINDIYQVALNGNLYANITNIYLINNAGRPSNNSLIARNYLTQVLGINIIF